MEDLVDSTHFHIERDWMSIWKMRIPPKVKLLLWRAVREVLLTRSNLLRRHVDCENYCPMCEGNTENEWYAFFDCIHAKRTWEAAGLLHQVKAAMDTSGSFRECFLKLMSSLCVDKRSVFVMILWGLWRRTNDKVWEGVLQPVNQVVNKALDFFAAWSLARARWLTARDLTDPQNRKQVSWQKPQLEGWYKCNVDTAIFSSDNKYRIGTCIHNSVGAFIKGKTMWFNGTPSPQEAEAMGLWQALLWLGELGLTSTTIELDCLSLVHGATTDPRSETEFGLLLPYFRKYLSRFPSFHVSFVRRQANLVAHTLARSSRCNASSLVFDCIPSCIDTIISNEMI